MFFTQVFWDFADKPLRLAGVKSGEKGAFLVISMTTNDMVLALVLITPGVFGTVSCGTSPERISRRSAAITSVSMSFGLGNSPCTSGGVKLKLAELERSIKLTGDDPVSDDRIQRALEKISERLPTNVVARIESSDTLDTVTHHDVSYFYGSIPICEMAARIHVFPERIDYTGLPARHPRAGALLDDTAFRTLGNPWPETADVLALLRRQLRLAPNDDVKLSSVSHCAALDGAQLTPLLDMRVAINGTPFDILGHQKDIRRMSSAVLFASGKASYLKNNPKTGQLAELELTDLADDVTTLNGLRFATSRTDNTARVERSDRVYTLPEEDPAFDEVNVYANAERIASWLQQPEKKYTMDCLPVTLELVPTLDSGSGPTTDNARYYPPKKGDGPGPLIRIAPGGKELQLLRRDYEVLAHEMGHHVLSRYLGGAIFPSVAIQEGVADFLVYAQTGDPCLAESICPQDSKAGCSVAGMCLRTANNTKTFDEFDQSTPYEPAEVLSSVLWNVGSRSDVGIEKMAQVILQALPYLKKDSQYADFFLALYKADLQMNGGSSTCLIEDEAKKRGFAGVLKDLPCSDFNTN